MPQRGLVRAFLGLWWTLGAVLLVLSVRTALNALWPGPGGFDLHVALIASIEAVGALLFLIPRTMRAGGWTLLATFAAASLLHLAHGEFPWQLLIDAAGVLFVIVHGPVPLMTQAAGAAHPGASGPPGRLLRGAPYFPVAEIARPASYYERVLGFKAEYSAGTPPQFAILSRDGLSIMLRVVPAPERICPNERQGGTWDAFFWVDDARTLHAEMKRNGADVVYGPLVQEAYRMLEFAVRDQEGYVLGFGEALEP
jgi:hypothetical protein